MPIQAKLTQSQLKSALAYNPNTGLFIWKYSPNSKVPAGGVAGGTGKTTMINMFGRLYKKSHLAWLYMTGYLPQFPRDEIDHIDGDHNNNMFSNLRLVDRKANCKNLKLDKRNKTGIPGIYLVGTYGNLHQKYKHLSGLNKYHARISSNGKYIKLYNGPDFFEACCRRKSAEIEHNFHKNHGRR